mgnify:CR=1 FL=1
METSNHGKRLFSAISINRITAERFRLYSNKTSYSHSENLDDMMSFFEISKISPRNKLMMYHLRLYSQVLSRLDFIIDLIREQERKYHKPTYDMLASLFKKAEMLDAKTSSVLEDKNSRKLTKEEWELEEEMISVEDYNSLLRYQKKEREEFSKTLKDIINSIEEVKPTFGKSYFKINISPSELDRIKRMYEHKR